MTSRGIATRWRCGWAVLAVLALVAVSCMRPVPVLVPPPLAPEPEPPSPTGSVFVQVRDASQQPVPFAQVLFLGRRRGEITDVEGNALVANVPIGMRRVRVNAHMNNPAVDSVMVEAGKVDTLRFWLEPLRLPNPPVASSVEEVLSDTARGSARLIVRVRPSPKYDVRITVRRNGFLVREKELLWDPPDHSDRAAFRDLSYGIYEVEAKGILRKRRNFLQFQYWKGAAKKTVILDPQARGNTQRVSLHLRWIYGGWGSYTVTVD